MSRFLDAVGDGLITRQDIKTKMDEIRADKERIKDELEIIESHLGSLPTQAQIRKRSSMWKAVMKKAYGHYTSIEKMSYEDQRHMVELALGDTDLDGARYGVYVRKGGNDFVTYEIKGNLPNLNFDGGLPVSDLGLIDALGIDDEYQDKQAVKAEIEAVKHHILSKRLGQTLQGELGRAVRGLERNAHDTRQRAHNDQIACFLPSQVRKGRPADPPGAEKIGFKLALGLRDGAVLHRPGQAEPRIADHDIDASGCFQDGVNAGVNRRRIADIHRN